MHQQQREQEVPLFTLASMHTACCLLEAAVLLATAAAMCASTYRRRASTPPPAAAARAAVAAAAAGKEPGGAEICDGTTRGGGSSKQQQPSAAQCIAEISRGLAEGLQRGLYGSGRRRSRVVVKVPSADSQGLPDVSLGELQERLDAADSSLHVQRLSVRSGCIILELDVAEAQRPSAPRSQGSSSAFLVSDAEWLELLNVRDIAADEAGNVQTVVSVLINDQVTQLGYNAETRTWVRTPDSSTALQLRPQCMTLDSQMARISLQGRGLAADGNKVEAVCAGRPLPCTVVSRSVAAGDHDVVVLEVNMSDARPGLVQCNVWGRMEPVSCLVATLPVLLLPSGCVEAAAQLTWVAAVAEHASAMDAFLDLGELLSLTSVLGDQPSTSAAEGQQSSSMFQQQQPTQPSAECLHELAASAANMLSWCQQAGYVALAHVVTDAADRLDQLMNQERQDSWAGTPGTAARQIGSRVHAADAGAAGGAEPSSPIDPAPAQPDAATHQPEPGWSMHSCWTALQRLDTAPNMGDEEQCSSALPTKTWTSFILVVYLLGICRCVASGQSPRETIALAFTALPYAIILASHVTGAADSASRAGGMGGPAGGSAMPATRIRRPTLAWWLARNSRLCLHVYRSLLAALMGLGYLPIPLVFKISLARPMAGLAYPLKMLYMVMEAYDWRAATLCLIFVDTPAAYLLLGNQKVPYLFKHLATLGWLGSTVQWLMSSLHACLESSSSRAGRAGRR